jgi:hypothetical protein
MKKTFLLFVITAVIGVARAQDADSDYSTADYQAPAVVYNAPVAYAAPVVYNAPVAYYGPVYYGLPSMAMSCALNACASASRDYSTRSTVTYIGGGHTGFQVSPPCNNGSTLVVIGSSWGH